MEEENSLRPIVTFDGYNFFVEDYQRGYKWEKQQVYDLLNDVKEFNDDVYCLQPIVVKKNAENQYELIDGQQRLTTIFMILSYLGGCNFSIDYNTRNASRYFLQNFVAKQDERLLNSNNWVDFIINTEKDDIDLDNVDNYHFFSAYQLIDNWFKSFTDEIDQFKDKLLNHVGVLWYEPFEDDVTKIFRNVNAGKIPLTNAELIKAFILISPDLKVDDRMQIARDWDTMEALLQRDKWWYSLNSKSQYVNRIEILFMLFAKQLIRKGEIAHDDVNLEDKYSLFRTVQQLGYDGVWNSISIWERIKRIFSALEEWYEDDEMFHFVGYILNTNLASINDLLDQWDNNSKSLFLLKLKESVVKEILLKDKIEELNYTDDNKKISNVLLLHNILSLRFINENVKEYQYQFRFRFDLFIKEKWSLEHIHARNEVEKTDFKRMIGDVQSTRSYYSRTKMKWLEIEEAKFKSLFDFTEENVRKDVERFKVEYSEFIQHIQEIERGESQNKIHNLSNMALLSGPLNSSIGNGYFDEKRNKIIEFDKNGHYILPATKYIFLKYYSKEVQNIYDWTIPDQKDYLDNINVTLNNLREETQL